MKLMLLLIVTFLTFSGCVVSTKKDISISEIPIFDKDNGRANKIESSLPKTVAVIPFYSTDKRASEIVTKYFYNSFSTLKYKDIELDTIYRILKDKSLKEINNSDIKTLSKLLDVDGLIIGEVTNFDKFFVGLYSSVSVGAKIKFYNAKTSEIIWEFNENAKKREGGISITPIGLAFQLAMAAYNLRDVQIYRAAEDLFRDIFTTIPEPKYSGIEELPKLKFVINNIKSKKAFKAGDELLFSIDCEKDLEVYISIPAEKNLIKMTQTLPGHYEAKYIINKNIDKTKGTIEYLLRRTNGIEAKYYDFYGELKIDNVPPVKPEIKYTIDGEKVNLTFLNTTGDEISTYKLLKLENNEYKELISSDKNEVSFNIKKGETFYLKPYTLDFAQNMSPEIETPLIISNLKDKRVLNAKELSVELGDKNLKDIVVIKNDTQITGNLRVKKGAVLFIEPNVKIELTTNGKIINEGGEILAYGEEDKKILITSKSDNSVITSESGTTILENVSIKADKGIILRNSSKLISSDIEISTNYDALHLKDSSSIELISSKISVKKDMAEIIFEGSSTGILNKIKFGNFNLFDVTSSSKKIPTIKNSGKIKTLGAINVQK